MILGIGTDLANIDRIAGTLERFGDRFRNRVFTETEQRKAERRRDVAGTYAKRWAAKKPVPRRWEPGCAWASHGKTCPSATCTPASPSWKSPAGRGSDWMT